MMVTRRSPSPGPSPQLTGEGVARSAGEGGRFPFAFYFFETNSRTASS